MSVSSTGLAVAGSDSVRDPLPGLSNTELGNPRLERRLKVNDQKRASLRPVDFVKPRKDFELILEEGMKELCDSLPKPDERISFEDDLFFPGQDQKGGPSIDLHAHVPAKVGRAMDKLIKAMIYSGWDNRADIVRSGVGLLFLTVFRRNGSPKVKTILGGIIAEREIILRRMEENGLADNLADAEKEAANAAAKYCPEEARDFLRDVIATATDSLPESRRKKTHLARLNELLEYWVKKCP